MVSDMSTKSLLLLVGAAFSVGCASSHSVSGPGQFGFLAKGGSCREFAEDAGAGAAIAFSLGQTPLPANGKTVESWQMLAFAMREPLQSRGWTKEELFVFAKDMMSASSQLDKVDGILTANLYFESACELLRKNQTVQPYSAVTTKLTSCLHRRDRREGLQCASGLIK